MQRPCVLFEWHSRQGWAGQVRTERAPCWQTGCGGGRGSQGSVSGQRCHHLLAMCLPVHCWAKLGTGQRVGHSRTPSWPGLPGLGAITLLSTDLQLAPAIQAFALWPLLTWPPPAKFPHKSHFVTHPISLILHFFFLANSYFTYCMCLCFSLSLVQQSSPFYGIYPKIPSGCQKPHIVHNLCALCTLFSPCIHDFFITHTMIN